ncbi:MAG TPA: hypothetical protein VMN57_03250 [Anaerolineales bacterium]|nr:hypothetical protein [Anaerolineales bacterium]
MKPFSAERLLHRRVLFGIVAFIGAAILAALLTSGSAGAAIELVYFRVFTEPNRIRLEWETATELNNAGFYVLRSQTGGNDPATYVQVTVIDAASGAPFDFIPARGDDLLGAVYVFYDEAVTIGSRYYYFLQDVDSSNSSSYHGPEEVVVGQTSTPAASVTPTGTAGAPTSTGSAATAAPTATRTNTPVPGFFPTATQTASSTLTGTAAFTDTPQPTATEISPIERTLTAIAATLTGFPTETTTATSTGLLPSETSTRTPLPISTTEGTGAVGEGPPTGRILLVVLVFLLSGGLLTTGIVYLIRDQAGRGGSTAL